jgi:hypothetical protein
MGRMGKGGKNPFKRVARLEEEGNSGRSQENEGVVERPGQPLVQDATGDRIAVHVLIPSKDQVECWFAYSLALAIGYMAKQHPYVDLHLLFNNGTMIAEQRTELAKIAMHDGSDWTIWFDSDMRFPKDTIERLLAHKQPIVCGGYPTRKPPAIEPTQYLDDDDTRAYTEKSSTGLQEIASGGFGCIAVHRSVFEAMPPPWFYQPWNEEEQRTECGEDIYFCRKARESGFKVLMDHDLSKEIAHIGRYEFTYLEALAVRPKIDEFRAQRFKLNGFK